MNEKLDGLKVAILVADGFEQVELTEPRKALEAAGAETEIISPAEGEVKGWKHTEWGDKFDVDVPLGEANAADYDALLLPGGVMNPDTLRANQRAVEFIKEFFAAGKPVASICHGPWNGRGGCRARAHDHVVAVASDRFAKRGGAVGGSRGRDGQWPCDEP